MSVSLGLGCVRSGGDWGDCEWVMLLDWGLGCVGVLWSMCVLEAGMCVVKSWE